MICHGAIPGCHVRITHTTVATTRPLTCSLACVCVGVSRWYLPTIMLTHTHTHTHTHARTHTHTHTHTHIHSHRSLGKNCTSHPDTVALVHSLSHHSSTHTISRPHL